MRFPLFFIIAGFIVACGGQGNPEKERPISADSIIPREQLIVITADMHIAEAILNIEKTLGKENRLDAERYYGFIWMKYHISRNQYLRNLERLKKNPEDFSRFYDEVIKNLEERGAAPLPEKE